MYSQQFLEGKSKSCNTPFVIFKINTCTDVVLGMEEEGILESMHTQYIDNPHDNVCGEFVAETTDFTNVYVSSLYNLILMKKTCLRMRCIYCINISQYYSII